MGTETPLRITRDDLTDERVTDLVTTHLTAMRAGSPPESTHAIDLGELRAPAVTLWSAWSGDHLAGIGALKVMDELNAELKSFATIPAYRGRGVGRALLREALAEAARRRLSTVWLETGSADDFLPARRLYESEGFVVCLPYGSYRADPLSTYMTRPVVLTPEKDW